MPGMVIFDPATLIDYLREKKIDAHDLFSFFINNEEIGEEVITKGILLPIYSIPEWRYTIIVDGNQQSADFSQYIQFEINSFPLTVRSELVIIADLSAITIDWDAEFFLNYEANLDCKSDLSHYTKILNGNYAVSIKGFSTDKTNVDAECGYVFHFLTVDELQPFDVSKSIDEYNFVIEPLNQFVR